MKKQQMKTFLITVLCAFFPWTVNDAKSETFNQTITQSGSHSPEKGSEKYFTGNVRIHMLFSPKPAANYSSAYVTFDPGSRTAWHTHPAGQHLVVISGTGYTQEWNGPVQEIKQGDVVWCPPDIKHWHGAKPDSSMTHMALTGSVGDKNVEWMEKVSDEQYPK